MFTLDVINLFTSGCDLPQNYFYSDLKKFYQSQKFTNERG